MMKSNFNNQNENVYRLVIVEMSISRTIAAILVPTIFLYGLLHVVVIK